MILDIPLMQNNINRRDLDTLIDYLRQDSPRLTHGEEVKAFEKEWSEWLGVKHSVFVNSGSSANYLTMAALKYLHGEGEIIVPPLTWSSDISAVLSMGFKPIFVDINPTNLAMDENEIKVLKAIKEQEGITQSTLKFRTDLSKAKVSQILTHFEKKHLVKRELKGKTYAVYLMENL